MTTTDTTLLDSTEPHSGHLYREPANLNVLLIDDDEVDIEGIRRSFAKLGPQTQLTVAKDGLEALAKLRGEGAVRMRRPDLILLDINMPRMTGLEFLRQIRADDKMNDLVVFVLTTSSSQKDIYGAYDLNVAGYMLKSKVGDSFSRAVEFLHTYMQLMELPT
ncbi:MAG: response regulator [Pseudomonadota bacterium]